MSDTTPVKVYTVQIPRREDYSGEHRSWTETWELPASLVAEIQADAHRLAAIEEAAKVALRYGPIGDDIAAAIRKLGETA